MKSFYRKNDITKFDNKNVLYVAYVGMHKNQELYKYGKSVSIYEREYLKHRKSFNVFEMRYIKITDNKDIIEKLFEKELKIRNLHTSLLIKNKKQTELFSLSTDYTYKYMIRMLNRLIKNNPSHEVKELQDKLKIANDIIKNYES
jgi:hypothetical protein